MQTTGYQIVHATGDLRKRGQTLLREHYTGSDGGSGQLYVVVSDGGNVSGACLIGPASSMAAERSLVQAPWRVQVIKRLYASDDCPAPETQLLRTAMRLFVNQR